MTPYLDVLVVNLCFSTQIERVANLFNSLITLRFVYCFFSSTKYCRMKIEMLFIFLTTVVVRYNVFVLAATQLCILSRDGSLPAGSGCGVGSPPLAECSHHVPRSAAASP